MQGDFSRSTFDPLRHFVRVLKQQGRVDLDADGNELTAILWHFLRATAADLIGPFGGPGPDPGFRIVPTNPGFPVTNFTIGYGHYYVDGILAENDHALDVIGNPVATPVEYFKQSDYPLNATADPLPNPPYLVYLDLWERHLNVVEAPAIREIALGGADTATRSKLVWQVKMTDKMPNDAAIPPGIVKTDIQAEWPNWVKRWQPPYRGLLKAQAKPAQPADADLCSPKPDARYRGPENQLYRVEIHHGGLAGPATFKWSRDNGSIVFPIVAIEGNAVTVAYLGRDDRQSLQTKDWVEVLDDGLTLRSGAGPLLQVDTVDAANFLVTLLNPQGLPMPAFDAAKHPMLRRWDYQAGDPKKNPKEPAIAADGALQVEEKSWLALEDGVQIWFEPAPAGSPNQYRTGDYWLIPTRVATGDVQWPGLPGAPEARPPVGIVHHFAPLALIAADNTAMELRSAFISLVKDLP